MLEFDKIAEMLKGHCHFNGSSKLVDELQIDNDLNNIKNKLDETKRNKIRKMLDNVKDGQDY